MVNRTLTYQELELQIVALNKQIESLKLQSSQLKKVASENYYIDIINHIGDPIFVKDEQSRLLLVNDAFCAMFNSHRDEIIGKTLGENVSQKELNNFLKIDRQVLSDGIENISEESITFKNNPKQTILTRKTRYVSNDGKRYLVGIIHDVTKRKKAENKLKESENQLKELNATKDKLFSIIAHDLRSPFNSILGFSELLIQNSSEFEVHESEEYIGIINESAKNTLILLDNLLNWAKSQTGQLSFDPKTVDFSAIISEIILLEKSIANNKNISLDYLSNEEMIVYADPNMLSTVLRNLISNAIKFTRFGGNIRVFALPKKDHVEIKIWDDGIGMHEEKRKNLFFITSDTTSIGTANENGSGLGLVLCKEFVEKNNGKIWAESEEGKGSTFYITLPHSPSNSILNMETV
jgi:PAS domain S-box-containing protein